jgi:AcrR family transcriptional regulator
MSVNGVRAKRKEATRRALCRHARDLFATNGYAATSTEDIARDAGVTKGALYHHFGDKQAVFRAVLEELEVELAASVAAAAAAETDPWLRLQHACEAYLDASLRPDIQRVLVLDAPSVLGWHEWCEIDKRHGFAMFEPTITAAVEAGVIDAQPTEMLAQILLGALNVAARVTAGTRDAPNRSDVWRTVARLLNGLRTRPDAAS